MLCPTRLFSVRTERFRYAPRHSLFFLLFFWCAESVFTLPRMFCFGVGGIQSVVALRSPRVYFSNVSLLVVCATSTLNVKPALGVNIIHPALFYRCHSTYYTYVQVWFVCFATIRRVPGTCHVWAVCATVVVICS